MSQVAARSGPQAESAPRWSRLPHISWGERAWALTFGTIAGLLLLGLIALGSRGFHWFDAALIGYAVASIFALALITDSSFVFPSLGPTAFLFFYTPTAPTASPRNTIIGHGIGVVAGYFSLVVTGLTTAGPALSIGVTAPRVIAAALSLGLTAGLMVLFKSPHPPAGATTLIISLGLVTAPFNLTVLMIAVVLLTVQAFVINRLAGVDYPLWNPRHGREDTVSMRQ